MSWEYKVDSFSTGNSLSTGEIDPAFVNERLNTLGHEGWELVSSYPTAYGHGGTRLLVFIYKRPAGHESEARKKAAHHLSK